LPHYFFYVRTAHGTLINDDKGVHLSDIEVALDEASRAAKSLGEDAAVNGYQASGTYLEIVSSDSRERIIMPVDITAKSWEANRCCASTQPLRFVRRLFHRVISYCSPYLAGVKAVMTHVSQAPLGRG
jgi:hypothetical protein